MAIKLQKNTKIFGGLLLLLLAVGVVLHQGKAQAACTVDTSRGTVTSNFTAPADGSYTLWTRMQASSATNDSVYISIDDSDCINVGDTAVATSGWTWVNWKDGVTSNITKGVQLTAGSHKIQIIGREDSVKVDRIMLLTGCTPSATGNGDDCVSANDTQPPDVSVTSPANNSTVIGATNVVQATATDNVGVAKVDFYIGGTLLGTDTTSPYSASLDATKFASGSYQLTAVATDVSGLVHTSTVVNITISNTPPDTQGPTLNITSPLNGSSMSTSDTANVTATATDASGVASVVFQVDGTTKATVTSAPYTYSLNGSTLSVGTHTITVKATDASSAGNVSTATVTINVTNATPVKTCDFNGDGHVTAADLSVLLSHYKTAVTPNQNGDCNGDGQVTIQDLSALLSNYGT